ncbi:disease resistance protein RGA2-like [Phoenix dactylifera]|uniref:Disease resistance protein RGA2-like n=1 Tax=Phoenix dactylifera TaxID=42345 RepID=A0A8B8J954_PHODC|nr:disease resistance protein RGA2-like [Phoenix dactylifera]
MAMIPDAFVSKLCWMLLTYANGEAVKILGLPNEIKKLHRRLERIHDVLADAEDKRFDNQPINRWLNELRDLMYDVDDIIDECWIEGEKLLSSSSSSPRCVESLLQQARDGCYTTRQLFDIMHHSHPFRERIDDRKMMVFQTSLFHLLGR